MGFRVPRIIGRVVPLITGLRVPLTTGFNVFRAIGFLVPLTFGKPDIILTPRAVGDIVAVPVFVLRRCFGLRLLWTGIEDPRGVGDRLGVAVVFGFLWWICMVIWLGLFFGAGDFGVPFIIGYRLGMRSDDPVVPTTGCRGCPVAVGR